jgi:predicted adenylyl cyclase CyaB
LATNIEIKARIDDYQQKKKLIESIIVDLPVVLHQEDTFFYSTDGRLKLRVLSPSEGQLIYYHRPDLDGPKLSEYYIYPTSEPGLLKTVLSIGLGVRGVVKKTRLVYLAENVRIHLDQVNDLGDFLELEVVFMSEQDRAIAEKQSRIWMQNLEIARQDLIEGAYIDLLGDIN